MILEVKISLFKYYKDVKNSDLFYKIAYKKCPLTKQKKVTNLRYDKIFLFLFVFLRLEITLIIFIY